MPLCPSLPKFTSLQLPIWAIFLTTVNLDLLVCKIWGHIFSTDVPRISLGLECLDVWKEVAAMIGKELGEVSQLTRGNAFGWLPAPLAMDSIRAWRPHGEGWCQADSSCDLLDYTRVPRWT